MSETVVPIIFLIAIIPITIIFVIYIKRFIQLFHSTNINQTLKDIQELTNGQALNPIDIQTINFLPNSTKQLKRFSTSLQITINQQINDTPIIGLSNIDTFLLSLWNIASGVAYIGQNQFKFIENKLGTKYYLNNTYIGYEPKVFQIYSYGHRKLFRNHIINANGEKVLKLPYTLIALKGSATSKTHTLTESIANQTLTKLQTFGDIKSILDYSTNKEIAQFEFKATTDIASMSSELKILDSNIDPKTKELIIAMFLATQMGI